jgi:hypothetical protein
MPALQHDAARLDHVDSTREDHAAGEDETTLRQAARPPQAGTLLSCRFRREAFRRHAVELGQ